MPATNNSNREINVLTTAVNIRSNEVQEFISNKPGLIVRWGNTIFFLILIGAIIGCWFIRYPDVIHAMAKVNAINAPKEVIAKTGGRIIKLFGKDGEQVKTQDIIGYMESTADHREVLALSKILDTLQYFTDSMRLEEIPQYWACSKTQFSHLGELQSAHQTFMQAYISFKDYLSSGFYVAKKKLLWNDLANTRKLLQILYEQKELQQQDFALTNETYNVHDTLHKEKLISDLDFRSQKSQFINKKMSLPQMNASIINNQGQQSALHKEMLELDNQIVQQKSLFIQVLSSYRNQMVEWKQKYLLLAPVSGKIVYPGFLEENQQVQANQVICFISNASDKYYVEMLLPQTNFGKVKSGQQVLLNFPSYPYQEFGTVRGQIEFIKKIPIDSGYLAKIFLPNGLITDYKKQIIFTTGLIAEAEIITDNKRLIDRFFGSISDLIK